MTAADPQRPELLAPAGDWDALKAAVANGADAVYFGLPRFNARHRATNFAVDELPAVMAYLHARNCRGFVAFNTLVFSDELPDAVAYARQLADARVDAVIVQDLGLARLLQRLAPALEVHASTQMTLTEPRGIELVRELGVKRVVLARELSTEDVRKVAGKTDMPLEVFVHGALCVAYSGQCLTSEALGGRSANRGQCAQACRLPYAMLVDGEERDLGERAYLLSPQDLAGHEQIDELRRAGVCSFKIEGRLKGPAYVAVTTRTYRAALDASVRGESFALTPEAGLDLQQGFSRGFTPGFLAGVNHQRLVQGRVPKSRGVRVGEVLTVTRRGVRLRLADLPVPAEALVKPGDGLVFDTGRPEQDEPGGRVFEVRPAREAGVVEVGFGREGPDLTAVAPGQGVWKTDDPAFRKRMDQTWAADRVARRVPVTATVAGRIGTPLTVTLSDGTHTATAVWDGPLERAQKHPPTPEGLREALGRLGETPFELDGLTTDLPDPVLVPKSVLNDLRRQAATALLARRDAARAVPVVAPDALLTLRAAVRPDPPPAGPSLHVLVRTPDQLDAVLAWRPEEGIARGMVWCDFEDVRRYRDAVARAHNAGVHVGLATLRILKPGEEGFLRQVAGFGPDAVLVRNLGGLALLREEFPHLPLVGDFCLNVANELTADWLFGQGLCRLVPSYDLNWEQLAALASRSDAGRLEVVVHQHMPMFHMEHCVFAAFLSRGKDWRDCGRPCERHRVELRDRVGAEFPVTPDAGCRNTVFNAAAQSAAEYLGRMLALGLRHFRVELLREPPAEVGPLLDHYARLAAGRGDGRDTWRKLRALNQLGVTRGTLQLV
jgi:putative protease